MDLDALSKEELIRELRGLLEKQQVQDDRDRLVHELEVHQVELELQNRELREAQTALEESRSRYADLYDFAPVAYLTLDTRGVVQEMNLTAVTMLGRDRAQVIGQGFVTVARIHEPATFWSHLRRGVETGKPMTSELRLETQRHGIVDVQLVSAPVFDPTGRPIAFRTSFTDITKRKEAEREIQRVSAEEARLRRRFERLDRVSLVLGKVLARGSDELLDTIASETREILDAKVAGVVIDRDPGRHPASWVISGPDPERATACALRPIDDVQRTRQAVRLRDVHDMRSFLAVPIMLRGTFIGALFVADKQSAEAFDDDDQRLAELLAVRIGVLLEVGRLHAEVRAAVRARDDLLMVVSHDLKSPLSAIRLSATLVARRLPVDLEASRANAIVIRCAEAMDRLIGDLLDAAALESGTFPVAVGTVDANELLDELLLTMEPIARARSIAIELGGADHAPPLRCDRFRILQVLTNLVGNALKFAPPGSAVQVRMTSEPAHTMFSVSDRGPGIPEDDRARLFDRYWKGSPAAEPGSGLGLFIAKGIVEAHGGRIWVESTPGNGATFSFTLPTARNPV